MTVKKADGAALVVTETGPTSIITEATDTGEGKVIEVVEQYSKA